MNNTIDMKLKNALGFSQKAGKVASGSFAAERAFGKGKAKLIVLDESASENTKKQWRGACAYRNVPFIVMNGLAEAIGKPGRTVAAVTDGNFSAMLLKNCGVNARDNAGNSTGDNTGNGTVDNAKNDTGDNAGDNADNNADSYGGMV